MGTWFSQNMNWRPIGFTKLTVFLRYLQYHGVSTAETRQKVEVRYCHRTRETPSAGIVCMLCIHIRRSPPRHVGSVPCMALAA